MRRPPPGQPYPPGQGYSSAPPPSPDYGYGQVQPGSAPPGMYLDPVSRLVLPNGVVLAPVGRRIGAYFLSIVLAIVTLGIGYVIWGLIAWGRGTSPALQVLGMRAWRPADRKVAGWGTMALRNIIGVIVQGILSPITLLVSFILFLSGQEHKSIPDHIAGTVIVHDPNKVLG